ncbi:DAPG hydrolase family protein [Nocardia nova]|uniref:DAPG hydrolase family protein n=1 Tax=Nocardia nova TaxID=37330 RepID=UPI0033F83849
MLRLSALTRRQALMLAVAGAWAATRAATARADTPDNLRYPGYSDADRARPYAHYMAEHTAPPQPAVAAAYAGAPVPAAQIPAFPDLVRDLAPTGYSPIETGYGRMDSGVVWVAAHTRMPRVDAAMWDWWFGWHLVESARYKLWHPDAHMYAEVAADRLGDPVPDRARYIGNISYVDEYIGPKLQQLAIAFQDPAAHGFDVPEGHTVVFGRVGSSVAPVDLGWLAHQVRPVPGGCEMRSRFYLRLYGTHTPDPVHTARAVTRGAAADPGDLLPGLDLARDLMLHCGQEMNHLSRFLPELYHEFAH